LKKKKGGKRETLDKPYPREKEEKGIGTMKHKNSATRQEDKQSQEVHSHTKQGSEEEESLRGERSYL